MIYYRSKELSRKLKINTAKWKRWVREFLPPDSLGGFQSGFARQFSLRDAFHVYLGGIIVGELKYSVPEAKKILTDLSSWINENGYFSLRQMYIGKTIFEKCHQIYIIRNTNHRFCYIAQESLNNSPLCKPDTEVVSSDTLIGTKINPIQLGEVLTARVLFITAIYNQFLGRLNSVAPEKHHYPLK
jgi:hypothetical protein